MNAAQGLGFIALASGLFSQLASASPYSLQGQLEVNTEYYDNSGNPETTFYSDEGSASFATLNLQFDQSYSDYKTLNANFGLLANDSSYRGEQGAVIERAAVNYLNGEASIPYSWQSGDILAFFSQRTLQTGLIGSQIEFQPRWGDLNHSIQLFSGLANTDYSDLDDKNIFSGASWLVALNDNAIYSFNVVYNARETVSDKLNQITFSNAFDYQFNLAAHVLSLEAELAYLIGDRIVESTKSEESDTGVFLQLSGRSSESSLSTNYQLRYERYGEAYTPIGAAVVADRESIEAIFGLIPFKSISVQTRAQHFVDLASSDDPIESNTLGLSANGMLNVLDKSISFSSNVFVNQRYNSSKSIDADSNNLQVNLSIPTTKTIATTIGAQISDTTNNRNDQKTEYDTLNVGVRMPVNYIGWRGSISPSVVINASDTSDQLTALLNMNAVKGRHNVSVSFRNLEQDQQAAAVIDSRNASLVGRYNYQLKNHRFGFEYDSQYRSLDDDASSQGYRVALNYRFEFDHDTVKNGTALRGFDSQYSIFDFHPVKLGEKRANAIADLAARSQTPRQVGPYFLSEVGVFDFINVRQLLLTKTAIDKVDQIGLIALPTNNSDAEIVLVDTLADFIRRFGSPKVIIEEGIFDNATAINLTNGSFERLYGWTFKGTDIYLGIPVRTDGQVRIEAIAGTMINPLNSGGFWGFQDINL